MVQIKTLIIMTEIKYLFILILCIFLQSCFCPTDGENAERKKKKVEFLAKEVDKFKEGQGRYPKDGYEFEKFYEEKKGIIYPWRGYKLKKDQNKYLIYTTARRPYVEFDCFGEIKPSYKIDIYIYDSERGWGNKSFEGISYYREGQEPSIYNKNKKLIPISKFLEYYEEYNKSISK